MNGAFWRKWHRWIGLPATLLLFFASVTGVLVAVTEFFGEEEALREATRDLVSPVRAGQDFGPWAERISAAVATVAAEAGDAPIDRVTIQLKGPAPTISVYTGKPTGGEDRRFVIDGTTGGLVETAAYVDKPFLHRLHSGEAFGDGGLVVAMFWGLGLAVLSVSGLFIYTTMWKPSRTGVRRFFW